jgi:SAM-dependent methyltransferase
MTPNTQEQRLASWREIVAAQIKLFDATTSENAADYRRLVESMRSAPAYHIRPILRQLTRIQEATGKAPSEIRILDHGCGGGGTLLYLAALGYTDVHGVDIGGHIGKVDGMLRAVTKSDAPRVRLYDGQTLPFSERTIDLIFSQQVLEHVRDRLIENYITEEVRVLNTDGIAYHQIPHRFTPWESHTKTWCIHYFPNAVRRWLYRRLGHDPDYIQEMLHLRTPSYFRRLFKAHFGILEDETLERLTLIPDPAYYDGNLRLRNMIAAVAKFPILGAVFSQLVMLDFIGRKNAARREG